MTPAHIVPEWYLLPFYAILRAIPNKLVGVLALVAAIALLAFLPWLDTSPVKSGKYRPLFRFFFWIFVVCCVGLGYLGSQEVSDSATMVARILAIGYFGFLLVVLPRARAGREDQAGAGCRSPTPCSPRARRRRNETLRRRREDDSTMTRFESVLRSRWRLLARRRRPALRRRRTRRTTSRSRRAQSWSFYGVFGKFDQAQLQRGFQVYKEVCSNCHRLSIPFRTLEDPDGPGYSEDAGEGAGGELQGHERRAGRQGRDVHSARARRPTCFRRRTPSPTTQAAAAALGKAPPDMWLLAKSRKYERGFPWFVFDIFTAYQEVGADYIYAILNGYTKQGRSAVEPLLSRPQDRDAGAACRTARSNIPTARRARCRTTPRTSPRS